MRASEIKTSIVTAIEAIAVDSNAGKEAFRHIDLGGRDPGALTERAFEVELVGISPSILITPDCQRASWLLTVYYHAYSGVEDRIADDAERVIKAMDTLHSTATDLYAVNLLEVGVGPSGAMDGMLEASAPLTVTYRRTGV